MFRRRGFGFLEQQDTEFNNTFGIMTREEGLRLTNDFARLTVPGERHVDYSKIAREFTNYDVKEDVITE